MVQRATTHTVAPPLVNPATDPLEAVEWWKRLDPDPLFVYVIQSGDDGPVKIGKARDPRSRLRELQCGNPYPLALRAVLLSAEDTEERLHIAWQRARLQGEWFGGGHEDEILGRATRAQAKQVEQASDMPKHPALRSRALYEVALLAYQMVSPALLPTWGGS